MHDSSKQTKFTNTSTSIHAWLHFTFEVSADSRREDAEEPNSAADQGAEAPMVEFHREKFSSPGLELWELLGALNLDVKDILEKVDYPVEGRDDDATEEPRK